MKTVYTTTNKVCWGYNKFKISKTEMFVTEVIALGKIFFFSFFFSEKKKITKNKKTMNIFLISAQKCSLWYSLKAPHQSTSDEHQQCMFSCKKIRINIYLITSFIWSYESATRSHHVKTCLQAYADSKGPDQTVHVHSLIRTFTVHS